MKGETLGEVESPEVRLQEGVLEASYNEAHVLGPIVVDYIRLGKAARIRAANLPITGGHLRVHPANKMVVRDFFVDALPSEVEQRTGLVGAEHRKAWPKDGEEPRETMFSEYLSDVMDTTKG